MKLNISMLLIFYICFKVFIPYELFSIAKLVHDKGIGLLNYFQLTGVGYYVSSVILLDLVIYWQHRLFHTSNFLWRFHRVHHSDKFLDASSAFRFHPIEMFLSFGVKVFFIVALGLSPQGVIVFEVLLSSFAIFNHANLRLSNRLNRHLARFFVTPDFHLVHHSDQRKIHDSNYGSFLSLWDKVFGSYLDSDIYLNDEFVTGLETPTKDKSVKIVSMLKLPFEKL
ncbi:sterol desaturase family protein [Halobacteriovorax sp. HLS]|uniref:sterol desaturase family protein n=1 Tax=Halobacteriovorax sp. HLS TaxID=2234000 RepID=UPI0013E3B379|nr:sterol desaturase family protein [Halobacteriovorax sp. HLS]